MEAKKIVLITILKSHFSLGGKQLLHTATEIRMNNGSTEIWEYGSKAAGKHFLTKRSSGRESEEEIVTASKVNVLYDNFLADLQKLCEGREWWPVREDYSWTDEDGIHDKTINCQEVCLHVAKNYMPAQCITLMENSMNMSSLGKKIVRAVLRGFAAVGGVVEVVEVVGASLAQGLADPPKHYH